MWQHRTKRYGHVPFCAQQGASRSTKVQLGTAASLLSWPSLSRHAQLSQFQTACAEVRPDFLQLLTPLVTFLSSDIYISSAFIYPIYPTQEHFKVSLNSTDFNFKCSFTLKLLHLVLYKPYRLPGRLPLKKMFLLLLML